MSQGHSLVHVKLGGCVWACCLPWHSHVHVQLVIPVMQICAPPLYSSLGEWAVHVNRRVHVRGRCCRQRARAPAAVHFCLCGTNSAAYARVVSNCTMHPTHASLIHSEMNHPTHASLIRSDLNHPTHGYSAKCTHTCIIAVMPVGWWTTSRLVLNFRIISV